MHQVHGVLVEFNLNLWHAHLSPELRTRVGIDMLHTFSRWDFRTFEILPEFEVGKHNSGVSFGGSQRQAISEADAGGMHAWPSVILFDVHWNSTWAEDLAFCRRPTKSGYCLPDVLMMHHGLEALQPTALGRLVLASSFPDGSRILSAGPRLRKTWSPPEARPVQIWCISTAVNSCGEVRYSVNEPTA